MDIAQEIKAKRARIEEREATISKLSFENKLETAQLKKLEKLFEQANELLKQHESKSWCGQGN